MSAAEHELELARERLRSQQGVAEAAAGEVGDLANRVDAAAAVEQQLRGELAAAKTELAAVPTHSGKVLKMAVPVSRLSQYGVVTNQVPVQVSPTLVLIDKARQASTIVGFADRFELTQRVTAALG